MYVKYPFNAVYYCVILLTCTILAIPVNAEMKIYSIYTRSILAISK